MDFSGGCVRCAGLWFMTVVNHKNLGGLINIHDLDKTMHCGLING